jgi:hypothetical protein
MRLLIVHQLSLRAGEVVLREGVGVGAIGWVIG